MNPQAILLDEVIFALDPEAIGEVLSIMNTLAAEGMTMDVVTHEMGFAQEVGDCFIFMDEGTLVEQVTPEKFFSTRAPAYPEFPLEDFIGGQSNR